MFRVVASRYRSSLRFLLLEKHGKGGGGASLSTAAASTSDPLGTHHESPDAPSDPFQISYTLPRIHLPEFPAQLSNFQSAKDAYTKMVIDGNKEQTQVYIDPNAVDLFSAIFPEIVESRRIGKIETHHFDTWNYRTDPERVLLERAFRIIDRDDSGAIDRAELKAVLKKVDIHLDHELFAAIDTDNSGEIDMEEFIELWEQMNISENSIQRLGEALRQHMVDVAKPLVENNVEVLMQPNDLVVDEQVDLLAVGGPSTYAAALIHKAQYPEKSILHIVGHRFDSNADGSAYYYHERDAFPLYVNKVNTGWYCVYADLMKRARSGESLRDLCVNDRHLVKVAIHWQNLFLQNPWMIFSIFIPNTYHAFMDLVIRKPKDSLMAQACLHSQRVPGIIETVADSLGLPKRAFLIRDPDRAVYIDVEGRKRAGDHFDWLNQYADIPYHSLDPSVFGPLVTEALAFDRDGALNPWMFENFYKAFAQVGIESRKDWFLDCLYVLPDPNEPDRLVGTAARFKNCTNGQSQVIGFQNMTFSLGPSGAVVMDPALSEPTGAFPKEQSLGRRLLNAVSRVVARGTMAYKGTMWAAGSSSVCLLGIKRGAATPAKLDTFRKFIDGVNQHWTLIKEREVAVGDDGTIYDFFVIQMTGGGHFPSRHTKPDFVLNLLYTTEAVFGLEQFETGDVVYDIVQSRGCGRSVSARNTVGFSPIAKNIVSAYGLGGIGMTTAFANGALQLQILEALKAKSGQTTLRKGARRGNIGSSEAQAKMKEFYGRNIFKGVNYQAMIDDPQKVARALGVDQSTSKSEHQWVLSSVVAAVLAFASFLQY